MRAQFLKEKGIPCETHQLARGMSPGEDLVRFAKEKDIDQIFVGVEKKIENPKNNCRINGAVHHSQSALSRSSA